MSGCPSSSLWIWTATPHVCHSPSHMRSRSCRAHPSAGAFGRGLPLRTAAIIARRLVHCFGGVELSHGQLANWRGVIPGPSICAISSKIAPCRLACCNWFSVGPKCLWMGSLLSAPLWGCRGLGTGAAVGPLASVWSSARVIPSCRADCHKRCCMCPVLHGS